MAVDALLVTAVPQIDLKNLQGKSSHDWEVGDGMDRKKFWHLILLFNLLGPRYNGDRGFEGKKPLKLILLTSRFIFKVFLVEKHPADVPGTDLKYGEKSILIVSL